MWLKNSLSSLMWLQVYLSFSARLWLKHSKYFCFVCFVSKQIVYAILDCATSSESTIPSIAKLREKYTYNICPWAMPEDEDSQEVSRKKTKKCPPPTCGGSLSFGGVGSQSSKNNTSKENQTNKHKMSKSRAQLQDHFLSDPLPSVHTPVSTQMKLLKEHYTHTARQPQKLKCSLGLVPPHARVVCPQTKKSVLAPSGGNILSYAADVPNSVLEKSKDLSGYNSLQDLHRYRKKVFTISYCQQDMAGDMQFGVGSNNVLFDGREKGSKNGLNDHSRDEDLFIRYSSGTQLP